jgi:hypothetical protein
VVFRSRTPRGVFRPRAPPASQSVQLVVDSARRAASTNSLFGWLVADGWCWFVVREEYCWLVVDGWFVVREKYCWLVADKPSEQGATCLVGLCRGRATIFASTGVLVAGWWPVAVAVACGGLPFPCYTTVLAF